MSSNLILVAWLLAALLPAAFGQNYMSQRDGGLWPKPSADQPCFAGIVAAPGTQSLRPSSSLHSILLPLNHVFCHPQQPPALGPQTLYVRDG
ncbi:hypothetical protein PGT21_012460 [Puccinia graminis f. sp. tritici]|uniref:Uncharacterized protein n=1 Tax=Puccinia graminis f. sp. tritici TaxID=56615 RepID=A0A5B0QN54_PUCGR|nr:hypothetical protein PGT21_012460 [Puccinia graminis f. sp. tritici]